MKKDRDWTAVRSEYIKDSNSTYKSLAKKYNISFHTLAKRATKEKWNEARQQIGEKQAKKTAEKIADGRVDLFFKLVDDLLRLINSAVKELPEGNAQGIRLLASALKDVAHLIDIKSEMDESTMQNCGVVILPKIEKALSPGDNPAARR